jgi:hypothetical protein
MSQLWCTVLEHVLEHVLPAQTCTLLSDNEIKHDNLRDFVRNVCRFFLVCPGIPDRMLQLLAQVLQALDVAACSSPHTTKTTAMVGSEWTVRDVACTALKAVTACLQRLEVCQAETQTVQAVANISSWLKKHESDSCKLSMATQFASTQTAITKFQQTNQAGLTQQVVSLQQQVANLQLEVQRLQRTADDTDARHQAVLAKLRCMIESTSASL